MSNRLLEYVAKPVGLALAGLLLVSCGGGGGSSGGGGFTGAGDTLDIEFNIDKSRIPANVTLDGPNTQGPFTGNFTIRVFDERGRLFPAEQITVSMDPVRNGALFYLDGDPEHEDDNGNPLAFRRLVFEETDGIATGHFLASSSTGEVRLTASVIDPVSDTAQTAELFVEVFDDLDREPSSLVFTGPFVDAVIAGAAFGSGDSVIANGVYQRVVSVIATSEDGIPARPNTQINFFLIDSPLLGFPQDGPGDFFIAGPDGDPLEGGQFFSAASGNFISKGVLPRDRLVLDGTFTIQPNNRDLTGFYTIQSVPAENQLRITSNPAFPNNDAGDTGPTVPYIVGRADRSNVLTRALTDASGTASTLLTYPATSVGRTAVLVACTNDRQVCTTLNTCDTSGQNCGTVFLPVSDGTNVQLTSSDTELGPNTSTPVRLCLRDINFTPIQATPIRYDIPGGTGTAVITVDGSNALSGTIPTGPDGCATVTIESTGQAPGTDPISIFFTADGVDPANPLEIMILGPGAGNLSGTTVCDDNLEELVRASRCAAALIFNDPTRAPAAEGDPQPTAVNPACDDFFRDTDDTPGPDAFDPSALLGVETVQCTTTLFLQDDRGGPIPGVAVTIGDNDGDIREIVFDPAQGANSGVTDENGENAVTVTYGVGSDSSITFEAGGASFDFTINLGGF